MTPSERAALVAQLAVTLDTESPVMPGDHNPLTGPAQRRNRLAREAAEWLAAAERVCAERATARPDMAESVTDGDCTA